MPTWMDDIATSGYKALLLGKFNVERYTSLNFFAALNHAVFSIQNCEEKKIH